jgi:hypothetical protein
LEAALEFNSCTLVACPEPGHGGSPARPNKEEIMRLCVGAVTPEESARLQSSRHKQLELGTRVTNIRVLHSLIVFSEPTEADAVMLPGVVEIPAGLGYDVECINPSRVAQGRLERLAQRGCANLVDIGIVISLEEADSIVVRTNGCYWRVFVTAESNGSGHEEIALPVALGDRSAGPLLRP